MTLTKPKNSVHRVVFPIYAMLSLACSDTGAPAVPDLSPGAPNTGGSDSVAASGGSAATGGNSAVGGAAGGGESTGGQPNTGGHESTGGAASGGLVGTGGAEVKGACGTAKICDDFESYAEVAPPDGIWTFLGPDNRSAGSKTTLVVDTSKAYSGSRSLHVTAPRGYGGAWIATTEGLPFENNVMWGRMMIYIENPGPKHLDFMRVSTAIFNGQPVGLEGYIHYGLVGFGGKKLGFQYMNRYDAGNGEAFNRSSTPIPESRWVCIEWHFDGSPEGVRGPSTSSPSAPKSELRAWLDGEAHEDMTRVPTTPNVCCGNASEEWTAPPFEMLQLGYKNWQPDSAEGENEEVWIDDVAVGTERIGCPD